MSKQIYIFDTTLRDGEQSPGASMNLEEKIKMARQLEKLGVDIIEAGFPISSVGDFESVKAIAQSVKNIRVAGLCRTNFEDIDRAWEAVQYAKNNAIHTFIATSDLHLEKKLKKSREEVYDMAVAAVKRAKSYTDWVEFSCEDASRSDMDYMCQVVEGAIDAGATVINLPDTVGYAEPFEYYEFIKTAIEKVPNSHKAIFSVHCHNDLGLAVANSLAAIKAGATQIECTVNGIGERAGNCSLEEIVMNLKTKPNSYDGAYTNINTKEIYSSSKLLTKLTGLSVQVNKAIVGQNAFAHEAGIHQHGVLADKRTYEIMDAESIGMPENKLILGKHSGKHALKDKLVSMGYELTENELAHIFIKFKELADKKKIVYDEDLETIVNEGNSSYYDKYTLEHFSLSTSNEGYPTATIKLVTETAEILESGIGIGSLDAVFKTINKMTPEKFTLEDFQIKAVTGGTDSLGSVRVKISDEKGNIFTGVSSELDIVLASAKAYIKAVNKLAYAVKMQ
ncbi:MAG: 2-isopropylmalate synthase [Armatimonadetes bacterium]|nr:2-isopropylmalate synthase [Candidatus Hippobium faecium]